MIGTLVLSLARDQKITRKKKNKRKKEKKKERKRRRKLSSIFDSTFSE